MSLNFHPLIVISTKQILICPIAHFTATRTEDWIDIQLLSGEFARIIPDPGGFKSQIDGSTTASVYEVAEIKASNNAGTPKIESSFFEFEWPCGFTLSSSDYPENPSPFDLYDENKSLIYIQNPKRVRNVSEMIGAGQRVLDINTDNDRPDVCLEYKHSGETWILHHTMLPELGPSVAITAQFRASMTERVSAALAIILNSIRPKT